MEKEMYLTNVGKAMLLNAVQGQTIAFTGFSIGKGTIADPSEANLKARTSLVDPVTGLDDISITSSVEQSSYVRLKGEFSSQDEFDDFAWSELGILAVGQGKVSYTGDGTTTVYQLVDSNSNPIQTYMIYKIELTVSGTTTTVSTDDYSYDSSVTPNTVTFDTAPADGAVIDIYFPDMSDKKLFAYGYDDNPPTVRHTADSSAAQAYGIDETFSIDDDASIVVKLDATGNYVTIDDFNDHITNYNNPHKVNVSQIPLENGTLTFTRASSLADLVSGESLKTLFGRLSKAVNDFISHKGNTKNPHKVTLTQTLQQEYPTNPVVPLSKGGTGVTTLAALQALVGGGSGNIVTGYYKGTQSVEGNYDQSLPRLVTTFASTPKLLVIFTMENNDPHDVSMSRVAILQNGTPVPSGIHGLNQTCSCYNGQFMVWINGYQASFTYSPLLCDMYDIDYCYFAIL